MIGRSNLSAAGRRELLNIFCPRRTRRGAENCFFVHGGHGGARRTALLSAEDAEGHGELLFCPRRTRRGAENCFFVRGGRGGARRTAFFHGGRGGARRTAFLSTEDTEEHGELLFCPRRTRRGTENCERQFLVVSFGLLVELLRAHGGSEELPFCPPRGTEERGDRFFWALHI